MANFPWWGGKELAVNLDPGEAGFVPRQLAVLRALLQYPHDLRPAFESALFGHYKAEVEGSYSAYDPVAQNDLPHSGPPTLRQPPEVWLLIDDPEVYIHRHFHTQSAIEFELSFNCEWNPEDGLGARYEDWQPVHFGSWDL
ncbi:MAG TPA: hypothetical protein VFE47_12675 [Tepidisphaeraceae bacterium]|nr:hypothetical protein [Tepidisphaeraceae bacterium]